MKWGESAECARGVRGALRIIRTPEDHGSLLQWHFHQVTIVKPLCLGIDCAIVAMPFTDRPLDVQGVVEQSSALRGGHPRRFRAGSRRQRAPAGGGLGGATIPPTGVYWSFDKTCENATYGTDHREAVLAGLPPRVQHQGASGGAPRADPRPPYA
jgi:hypothetical protein